MTELLYILPAGLGVMVYLFLYNKKKNKFDGDEDNDWKEFKSQGEAYVKTAKHIQNNYSDYDVEITNHSDGGKTFKLDKEGTTWSPIFTYSGTSKKPKKEEIPFENRIEANQAIRDMKKFNPTTPPKKKK